MSEGVSTKCYEVKIGYLPRNACGVKKTSSLGAIRRTSPYLCRASSTAHGYLPENLKCASNSEQGSRILAPKLTSDKHTRCWRQLPLVGLGTWKADENREDTDIVLLRRELSTSFIRHI